ncbi:alpha-2-macroglobulin family protein [Providencia sp. Me31A]|uniref:alpha-2-macroglobulin family protein n=1 Tax=Providencia sp. Me31A TaxID=3392637 RepID=UPI003D2B8301
MDILRFLLRQPFLLIRVIGRIFVLILRLIGFILRPIVGNIQWTTPTWVVFTANQLKRLENGCVEYPKSILCFLIGIIAVSWGSYYGYHSYLNRAKPIEVAPIVVQNATIRVVEPRAIDYKKETQPSQTISLVFSRPSAPIEMIGKVTTNGLKITPAIEGKWVWRNDRILTFTAQKALPMGKEFLIEINDEELLAPQVTVNKKRYHVKTPDFSYRLNQKEFYQDPQDPLKKHVIYTLAFNAPINVQSFEKNLNIRYADNKKLKYTVNYDDKKLTAWVHSELLEPKNIAGEAILTINKGIQSTVSANSTAEIKEFKVVIPSIYNLKITSVDSKLVKTAEGKDSRALLISLNDKINEKELSGIKVRLLPVINPEEKNRKNIPYNWTMDDISDKILDKSEELTIKMNDNESEMQSLFSFTYKAPANRFLLVQIPAGIASVGGYHLKNDYLKIVRVPDYPILLNFISEGSLLSMKGEKHITVASRNLAGLQLDIKRVIPNQLHHVVSFKEKKFTSINFNRLNDEYFTEHFKYQTTLNKNNEGEIQYKGIDLSQYLSKNPNSKHGIFLLTLREWAPENNEDYESESDYGDSRFVVVTDLGIIAKTSIDGSRDVFVQSIYTGEPVTGAKVSVIAKNGTTLLSQITDAGGHVAFSPLNDFRNEQTAVMFLVEKEGDVSFLPTSANYDRRLDLSRFDIYGDETPLDPRTLDSYLFSDRGVYRPGDRFNIGLITRTHDWKTSTAGIPLRIEVRDPRNTLMLSKSIQLNDFGFNELSYTTSENAPTGDWNINLYLVSKDDSNDSLLGSTTITVKEFEPDTMKVAINLTPDRSHGWVKPDELKAQIDVQNLFGTPAQDRRVMSKLTLRPVYPSFSQYKNYMFNQSRRNQNNFEMDLEARETDENGKATIDLGLKSYDGATYQMQLFSEAFEAGSGRSVMATARVLVSPHDYLVGIKADGSLNYINQNALRKLHVIAIDPTLNQIAQQGLSLEILEQKYISVLTRQNSGVFKYQSKLKETLVSKTSLNIDQAGNEYVLNTQMPGNYILLVKNADGNILNRVHYSIAGNANITRSLDRNAELKLTLNKDTYKPGEDIEISINAPYAGSGIITIERDKVYHWTWFKASTTNSVQKIRVPEQLTGNGYVNVQFIRDINSDEILMSPLSFGIKPFNVNHSAFQANVKLDVPEIIKPGETLAIKVNTDKQQKVAIFAVDEGILQVANYQFKDPLDYFFRKRSLEVQSMQILDLILPEFNKLNQKSAPGGDAGEDVELHLNPFKRKKDEPVAYWSGITDVNGEATFEYKVPNYFNGKIRVMAVTVTQNRIGHTQSSTVVRDDFVLSPNIPTTVSPGDIFDVTLGISNNLANLNGEKSLIDATLSTEASLEVIEKHVQQISLREKQEGVVTFKLKANATLGNAPITFMVKSGDKSTTRTVNLSIRPAAAYRSSSAIGRMEGKQQTLSDIRQMFDHYAVRNASVSYSPLVLSNGLSQYLADYPYNCSEQITSQAIPLLFQHNNPEMKNRLTQSQINQQIDQTLTTLLTRQNGQGMIGDWRATPNADPYVTLYVVQFLLEAKEANYPVSRTLLTTANGYLKKLAANTTYNNLHELRYRAFATYLLTRQGVVTTNMLSDIQTRMQTHYADSWKNDIGALYLAASYKMLKMDSQAETLLKPTWDDLSHAYDKAWWSQNFLDPLVQDSIRLYLIVRHFPEKAEQIPPQLLENMVLKMKDQRYTTHSSAMSILALEYYTKQIQRASSDKGKLTINIKTKNNPMSLISTMENATAFGQFPAETQAITLNNPTDNPAWYVVTQAGFDNTPPTQSISQGLEITREYINKKGQVVNTVTLGEKLYVHIKVRANSKEGVNDIVVVDLLPGGFEIVQQPLNTNNGKAKWPSPKPAQGSIWYTDYSDVREDRIILYGRAKSNVQEYVYEIKATNTGVYAIPAAYGEAMYDRKVQALAVSNGSLTVTLPDSTSKSAMDNDK